MIFQAKDFKNREEIEQYIIAEVGQDSIKNRDALNEIVGKREELKKLNLDDLSTIFGCRVRITDLPTTEKIKKPK